MVSRLRPDHYARRVTARLESVTWPGRSIGRVVRRTLVTARIGMRRAEASWLFVLICLNLFFATMAWNIRDQWPLSSYVLPLLLAMNVMSFRRMMILVSVTVVCLAFNVSLINLTALRFFGILTSAVAGGIVTLHTYSRTKLGLEAIRGDSMLVDLRDRLAVQSRLPELPEDWHAEAVMRSAGGASFSGDFVVASKTEDGHRLEVAVVDVSGKGLDAGTRSLQLSGAFGGLLGSLPSEEFLPAANAYVLRQEWPEGFATCVQVALDLDTGDYELRTAGHPPALQFHAGSGRWTVNWTEGPMLGVVTGAEYLEHRGRLSSGDALLLYTDGLVETPHRDIVFGIDGLLGSAERLVQSGFEGGAERLVMTAGSSGDDCALVLLHRR
jgi:hypothetical protein